VPLDHSRAPREICDVTAVAGPGRGPRTIRCRALRLLSLSLAQTAPDICTDQSGFDRAAFHREFNTAVMKFLQDNLK